MCYFTVVNIASGKTVSVDDTTYTSPTGQKIKIKTEKDITTTTPSTASREGLRVRGNVLGSIATPEGRRASVRLTAKKTKQ